LREPCYNKNEEKGVITMAKLTMDDYAASLWNKKTEAHDKQWLYIEINAKDFNE